MLSQQTTFLSSDVDIIPLLRNKDEAAFETLFRMYYESLVRFSVRYVNSTLAEEIVQEVFFKFWEKSGEISVRTSVKSYLYGAVRNACLNHIKHEKVKQSYSQSFQPESAELPTDLVEIDELKSMISEALDSLPEKCREVFEKSRNEEKSYKEIADELDISVKTVENHMGKALKILRDKLGHLIPVWLILEMVMEIMKNE